MISEVFFVNFLSVGKMLLYEKKEKAKKAFHSYIFIISK
jgi:hypothetical protein